MAMLKNLEMILSSVELTHASEKLDFATKEFGAEYEIRSQAAGTTSSVRSLAAVANQLAAA